MAKNRVVLACLAVAAWLGCAGPVPPPEAPARLEGRVLLVPLNVGVRLAPELAGGVAPVWSELEAVLAGTGLKLAALDQTGAVELWNEATATAGEAGESGDLHRTYAHFARRVAEEVEYERLVVPALVTRAARLAGRTAQWDGVRRRVEVPSAERQQVDALPQGGILVTRHGAQGQLAAASLHVVVLSRDGAVSSEGRGGLVLLHEIAAAEGDEDLRVALRDDPWAERAALRDGIALALGPSWGIVSPP